MSNVSTTSKIVDQCRNENVDVFATTFSSGGCSFMVSPDDIRNYFIEYSTGQFTHIIE